MKRIVSIVMACALAAALGACASKKRIEKCPAVAPLTETQALAGFAPGQSHVPSHEAYRIGVVRAKTDCDLDPDTQTSSSSVDITFRYAIMSGPPAPPPASVPYYVAVTRSNGTLVSKREFSVAIPPTPGEFTDSVGTVRIKVDQGKHPTDYEIVIGLQLTKDQLDYNRRTSRFEP